MRDVFATLIQFLLLAVGLVVGATLFMVFLLAMMGYFLIYQLRLLWARITGKEPVTPWPTRRFDPRTGFEYGYHSMRRNAPGAPGARSKAADADVTDVVPRMPSASSTPPSPQDRED